MRVLPQGKDCTEVGMAPAREELGQRLGKPSIPFLTTTTMMMMVMMTTTTTVVVVVMVGNHFVNVFFHFVNSGRSILLLTDFTASLI